MRMGVNQRDPMDPRAGGPPPPPKSEPMRFCRRSPPCCPFRGAARNTVVEICARACGKSISVVFPPDVTSRQKYSTDAHLLSLLVPQDPLNPTHPPIPPDQTLPFPSNPTIHPSRLHSTCPDRWSSLDCDESQLDEVDSRARG